MKKKIMVMPDDRRALLGYFVLAFAFIIQFIFFSYFNPYGLNIVVIPLDFACIIALTGIIFVYCYDIMIKNPEGIV